MRTSFFACAVFILGSVASYAQTNTYYIFKTAATIPVQKVIVNPEVDKTVVKTLASNDLINLALGRTLGSKVDAKKEVLALAVVLEGPGVVLSPLTHLIVYDLDPAVTGAAKVKATIAKLSALNIDVLTGKTSKSGQGIGTIEIQEIGVPGTGKLYASILNGSGKAVAVNPTVPNTIKSFAFSLISLGGRLHFEYIDPKIKAPAPQLVDFDGVVIKGMVTTTAKPIGTVEF